MRDPELAAYRPREGGLGSRWLYFEQAGSTNDIAREEGEAGAPEGLVVIAEEQTAGRGRLGRRWEAPPGSSLLLSVLFRPPEPFAWGASRTTMLCGIALVEAARQIAGVDAWLKWPNDLIVTHGTTWGKLAGMLSEVGMEGERPAFLVVGMGLNVNVPADVLPGLAPNAAGLSVESGRTVSRVALLDRILKEISQRYAALRRGEEPLPAWRERLAWIGQPVRVETLNRTIEGRAEGVDDQGALLVRCADGTLERFPVGDVSLRA